jgi:hypothetical protein
LHELNNETPEQSKEHGKAPNIVTVKVNNRDVTFQDHKTTGLEIKKTAISQGLQIKEDFALFEEKGGGNHGDENLKSIEDDEPVTLHPHQRFRAVSPDDTSSTTIGQ